MAVFKFSGQRMDLGHPFLCGQKLLYQMQPALISLQRFPAALDHLVDTLSADAFLFGDGVTVIEWGELMGDALPNDYLHLTLYHEDQGRRLELAALGSRSQKLMEAWKDAAARIGD